MNRKPETAMAVLAEIHEISERLEARPGNLKDLVRIASLYLEDSKPTRSRPYLDQAVKIFQASPKQQAYQEADDLANLLIKFWKAEKHTVTPKGELRLNLTPERESLLGELERAMLVAMRLRQPEFAHSTALKMAYVREALGEFQASLALLSELISEQAVDGVDLSYIIFKAAIVLKHLGQAKQSIEYLEFIQDDPPLQDGFTKTHVCAFLTLVYEQSGDKYKVFLPKAYKELRLAFGEDFPGNKLLKLNHLKFSQAPEMWEMFALQALERCEYVMAAQFLSLAIEKEGGKAKLLHLEAEIYALLKQKSLSSVYAEQAYEIMQTSELRNLLLQVAPAKWTEKLRKASVNRKNEEEMGTVDDDVGSLYAPPTAKQKAAALGKSGGGVGVGGVLGGGGGSMGGGGAGGGGSGMGGGGSGRGGGGGYEEEERTTFVERVRAKAGGTLMAIHNGTAAGVSIEELAAAQEKRSLLKEENEKKGEKGDKGGDKGAGGEKKSKAQRIKPVEKEKKGGFMSGLLGGFKGLPSIGRSKSPSPSPSPGSSPENLSPGKSGKGEKEREEGERKERERVEKEREERERVERERIEKERERKEREKRGSEKRERAAKLSKYNVSKSFKERLTVSTADSVGTKLQKPQLTPSEQGVLNNILRGGNVTIYDPTLAVLYAYRVSNKGDKRDKKDKGDMGDTGDKKE